MTQIFNNARKTSQRMVLRNNPTRYESVLWTRLCGKQMCGRKFRRQYGIGPYVVDFYCVSTKLIIEVDGDSHFTTEAMEYDRRRSDYFRSLGLCVLRFTNLDIAENFDGVLERIREWVDRPEPPLAPPS